MATGASITWSSSPWSFDTNAPIALAIVSATLGTFAVNETHGLMPWQAHRELHEQIGTYRRSGGTLTAGTYAVQPGSPTDADNTPGVDVAVVADEDLPTTIPAWTQGTYTQLRNVAGSMTTSTGSLPFRMGTNYPLVNIGGAEVEGATGDYLNVYAVFVPTTSDAGSQAYRVLWLQPQVEHSSLANAQAEQFSSLTLADLTNLLPEFCAYIRVTYRCNAAYTGATGRCRIEDVSYISQTRAATSVAPTTVTATNVAFTPTGNISAINVQAALAELDTEKAAISSLTAWATKAYPTDAAGVLTNDGSGNLTWSAAGSGVTGTGVANQVAYWSGTSVIAGSTSFTFNSGTGALVIGTDPGGSETLRVAGSIAASGSGSTYVKCSRGALASETAFVVQSLGTATWYLGSLASTDDFSLYSGGVGTAFSANKTTRVVTVNTGLVVGTDPTGSELLRVGGAVRTSGNIGVGATAVTAFHATSASSEAARSLRLSFDGTYYSELAQAGAAGLYFRTFGGVQFTWQQNSVTKMYLDLNGVLIIGTDPGVTGTDKLGVDGSIRIKGGELITINASGAAAPAFTTRSAGSKFVLWPALSGTSVDYAIGIQSNFVWFSTYQANSSFGFKWYAGTTQVGELLGNGNLTVTGSITNVASTVTAGTVGTNQIVYGTGTNNGVTSEASLYWDATNKVLDIGSGAGGAGYGAIRAQKTYTGLTSFNGNYFFITLSPASAISSATLYGLRTGVANTVGTASNFDSTNTIVGIDNQAYFQASGTRALGTIYGQITNCYVQNQGTGTTSLANLYGSFIAPTLYASASGGSTTVAGAYGIFIRPSLSVVAGATATLTSWYGLFVDQPSISGSGTITNEYPIYQGSTAANSANYFGASQSGFAGRVGVGIGSVPAVSNGVLQISRTTTDTSSTSLMIRGDYAIAPTSAAAAAYEACYISVQSTAANAANLGAGSAWVGHHSILQMNVDTTADGSIASMSMSYNEPVISNTGASGRTASVGNVTGFFFRPTLATTNAGASSTISNLYGIFLNSPVFSGSGTNTIANRYGIYQEDSLAGNYFAGRVSIGNGYVAQAGDLGVARSATTGAIYFGTANTRYIYFDGTNWSIKGATGAFGVDANTLVVTGANVRFDWASTSGTWLWQVVDADGRFRCYDNTHSREVLSMSATGDVGIGGNNTGTGRFQVYSASTATAGAVYGQYLSHGLAPTSAAAVSSFGFAVAGTANGIYLSTSSFNTGQFSSGFDPLAAGTLSSLTGVYSQNLATSTGAYTSTINSAYAYFGNVYCQSLASGGSTVIVNAYGALFTPYSNIVSGATGSITNYYGLYLQAAQNFGAVAVSITNNWGVYQADTTAKNYFAGQVGIGTTLVDGYGPFQIQWSTSATTAQYGGFYNAFTVGTGAATTSASYFGQYNNIYFTGTNGTSAALAGLDSHAYFQPTAAATLGTLTGIYGSTLTISTGAWAVTSTATYAMNGITYVQAGTSGGAANITSAHGFYAALQSSIVTGATATITNYYGIYLSSPQTFGAVAATITNHWGVYQVDSSAKNYFAGIVSIGSTPSAGYGALQIVGFSSSTSTAYGLYHATTFGPGASATSATYTGQYNNIQFTGTNATSATMVGQRNQTVFQPGSAATLGTISGTESFALVGSGGSFTSTATTAKGVSGIVYLQASVASGAATIGTAYGLYSQVQTTIAASASATITSFYGLYLDTPTNFSASNLTITNNYGVYQADTTATNTFLGVVKLPQGQIASGRLFSTTSTVTVANSNVDTTIKGTVSGTDTIAANALKVGTVIRVRVAGVYSTAAATTNLTLTLKIGATSYTVVTGTTAVPASMASRGFEGQFIVTVLTTGSSGTCNVDGHFLYKRDNNTADVVGMAESPTNASTIDTTASKAIDVLIKWGAANASNSFTCQQIICEIL
jgi:hypothetical protein